MSTQIVKPNDYDKTLVNFGDIITNAKGGRSLNVGYNDEKKFLIKTPVMEVAFKVEKEERNEGTLAGVPKCSMQVSFKGMDDVGADGELTQNAVALSDFHTFMNDLDDLLIDSSVSNAMAWHKKKSFSKVLANELINHIVKQSRNKETGEPDGKYPDTMKIRIPVFKDKKSEELVVFGLFDKDKNPLTKLSDLQKLGRGARVTMVLECSGVYFTGAKYGYSPFSIYQCRVWKEAFVSAVPRGVCLITDSDDDEPTDEVENATVPEAEVTDELDGQPEVEKPPSPKPEPTPAAAPAGGKKRVVRRAK